MTLSNSDVEKRTLQAFKIMNRFMLFFWRLGLGYWFRWPRVFGCIMVITHRGRKTGLMRRTPVNFAKVGNDLFCTAGFGAKSDWYLNILKDPRVEVWLPDGWWKGTAEDVTDVDNATDILRKVIIGSGIAARVFGLNPYELPDQELEKLLKNYRIIRIHCTEARTGPGGPGDLAWIWPVITLLLIPMLLIRNKSTKQKS